MVTLPADAKLTFGDQATRSISATRTFLSPPLEPGFSYYYTLKAEIVRDGRPLVETMRVPIRAGQETKVAFSLDAASLAQK